MCPIDYTVNMATYADWMAWYRNHKYGLTPERFKELLVQQDEKCAICRCVFVHVELEKPVDRRRKRSNINVDHCHKTGVVRGLLCAGCNRVLGNFEDEKWRASAQAYLDASKQK